MKKLVIAIDGPAASGKSTTSKLTAQRLGYIHIDTGAMYRAMTLKVLLLGVDPANEEQVSQIASKARILLRQDHEKLHVLLDDEDVSKAIREPKVTRAVSLVSSYAKVREAMVREQRRMALQGGVVLEGRDIGTVVLPSADLKIFMVAHVNARALRRQKDYLKQGVNVSLDELRVEIEERDRKDSEREISPLRKASDAIVLDTSDLSIDEQVDFIVQKANEILQRQE